METGDNVEPGMRRMVIGSVVAAVVLTIAVVATAVFLLRDPAPAEDNAAEQGASESVDPQHAAGLKRCPAGPVAGVELPCLGETDDDDTEKKSVTVVNVWAWWCGPCRDELPLVAELRAQHPEWTVVGVHADPNRNSGATFLSEVGADLPSYQDDSGTFAGQLGLPGVIPVTVVAVDGEMVKMYPKTFESVAELEGAVRAAVGEA